MKANLGIGRIAARTLVTGSVANLVLTVGLAMAAEAEGKAPLRPVNATSHWLNGDFAGETGEADCRRTGVGMGTNLAACLFWAAPFEVWQALRQPRNDKTLVLDAGLMAVIAAIADYGPTPRRFTPGWEHVLSRSGMAAAYSALALGLAAGLSLGRSRRRTAAPLVRDANGDHSRLRAA